MFEMFADEVSSLTERMDAKRDGDRLAAALFTASGICMVMSGYLLLGGML